MSGEATRMLHAIVRGSQLFAGEGWFGPAENRFSWKWLAEKHGIDEKEAIAAEKFLGSKLGFSRLDRNQDGKITADELDWADTNPWVRQSNLITRFFRRMDPNGDGKLTREEWLAFYDKIAQGQEHIAAENLRNALLIGPSGFLPGDAPDRDVLVRGLFAGEIGSLQEGPHVNEAAPDFTLETYDGERKIHLAEVIGKKPVVLTFGNFTCGPFRAMFPEVEEIHKRFASEAEFLAVYVREAHPTDGWKMESNAKQGVAVAQPKTKAERSLVATQCHRLLKPDMPLLVDDISDPVGNAYSGMPARMYVIDLQGKVAYKSGRGPFGFKAGEMEQALVMTLLEQAAQPESIVEKQE